MADFMKEYKASRQKKYSAYCQKMRDLNLPIKPFSNFKVDDWKEARKLHNKTLIK